MYIKVVHNHICLVKAGESWLEQDRQIDKNVKRDQINNKLTAHSGKRKHLKYPSKIFDMFNDWNFNHCNLLSPLD